MKNSTLKARTSGFVISGPKSQKTTRTEMSEIDEQICELLGSIAPQQRELDQLSAEYNNLQKSLLCDGETNERMRSVSARISRLHGEIQPVVEQVETLKPKYRRLQKTIS